MQKLIAALALLASPTCPTDSTILAAERGAANTCVDVSVQAYKDSNTGAGA